ncbi:MAG: dihydropteroate synthase [candidate division Zixibacteria bacterium]|nr:dihydropteroate synthase [candidate division Zixibacteria bacterium]
MADAADILYQPDRIIVMGVVNTTPDSFSDGGQFLDADRAVAQALRLAAEGADIIDIGGESTRPGAEPVAEEEEIRRVIPVIERLARASDVAISIDTVKARVAQLALQAGAKIVNDISALQADEEMAATVAQAGAGVILMHRRGTPQTMQANTNYDDLVAEVREALAQAIARAEDAGCDPRRIMIDPGIGFGKSLEGNLDLIRSIKTFASLGKPVLIGASRKSFVGRITGAEAPDRLGGSLAAAVAAVLNGAAAVRAHDVKETRQAVDVAIRLRGRQ